ncbi:Nicotianamine synthase 3 [Castilleja foliolosa]|uniref:Nicotianamine synthase n=1 Tax=Castilleja foliolosa TaxID=1961234 RepID=A0ABD3BUK6_9LAMI
MVCLEDPLVQKIHQLYHKISTLDTLNPSPTVDELFNQLVTLCIPPHPIDVTKLCPDTQTIRTKLITLCGHAEGLLEKHYSTILSSFTHPLHHLHLFPYYQNYLKLASLESDLLRPHCPNPARIAFLGSGPLPLTSILLASLHLKSTIFHNFDMDQTANVMAERLVGPDPDLSRRMSFFTNDVMDVSLGGYDVVFLAALVGMEIEEKVKVVEHLARSMDPGAVLVARSAHGARAFLYPVVETRHLRGFEVVSVFHPTDEVINSVVVARRCPKVPAASILCGNKCVEISEVMNSLVEELITVEEHL